MGTSGRDVAGLVCLVASLVALLLAVGLGAPSWVGQGSVLLFIAGVFLWGGRWFRMAAPKE